MRGLLGFFVFVGVVVGALAVVLVPVLVAPLVAAAVRDVSPFEGQDVAVEVDVDPLGLIRGFVSEIRMDGADLAADDLRIGTMDVTARGVRIDDHSFAEVAGSLSSIEVPMFDGAPVTIDSVTLSGPSDAVAATASLDAANAATLIRTTLADVGVDPGTVTLVDGGIAIEVFGQPVQVALAVDDGALVIPPMLGLGPIPIIAPGADDPWRITALEVTPDGLVIEATVDAVSFLARDRAPDE
jgi:hypothetical protein